MPDAGVGQVINDPSGHFGGLGVVLDLQTGSEPSWQGPEGGAVQGGGVPPLQIPDAGVGQVIREPSGHTRYLHSGSLPSGQSPEGEAAHGGCVSSPQIPDAGVGQVIKEPSGHKGGAGVVLLAHTGSLPSRHAPVAGAAHGGAEPSSHMPLAGVGQVIGWPSRQTLGASVGHGGSGHTGTSPHTSQ
mmetsp:Transcript_106240/g.305448  ORF Transcript_106240/g.305448 Transcript_106240/m.305448 type:complete len:186 (-) Transcript_106240:101-658(-)